MCKTTKSNYLFRILIITIIIIIYVAALLL